MKPELVTRRLDLRQFTEADVDHLLELDADPAVMRYLGPVRSRAEIVSDVLPRLLSSYGPRQGFGTWAAETLDDGAFVGWFGLRPVAPAATAMVHWADAPRDTGVASLGYRLRRAAWGSGYATEGALALVRYAFASLNVRELVATTMAVNAGSRHVLEKAGLEYRRTVYLVFEDPLDGNEHGDVEYRLLRGDWERRAQPGGVT